MRRPAVLFATLTLLAVVLVGGGIFVAVRLVERDRGRQRFARERLGAAIAAYEDVAAGYRRGSGTVEDVYRWSIRILDAHREMDPIKGGLRLANKEHLIRMTDLDASGPPGARALTAYYLKEAEFWVASRR